MTTNTSFFARHFPTVLGLAALALGLLIIFLGPWPIVEVYRDVWHSITGAGEVIISWARLVVWMTLHALGLD